MKIKKFIVEWILPWVIIPLLGVILYFQGLPSGYLLIIFLALYYLPKISSMREKWENYQWQKKARTRVKNFRKFLLNFEKLFHESFLEFPEAVEAHRNLIEYSEEIIPPQKSIFLDLLFIYLKEKEPVILKNYERNSLAERLERIREDFSLENLDERDRKLAWGFYCLFCEGKESIRFDTIKNLKFLNDKCFENRFVNEYVVKEKIISNLTSEKKKLEDYRDTLSQLWDTGKLDKFGIYKMISDVKKGIERVLTNKIHYFILFNGLYDGFKKQLYNSLKKDNKNVYKGKLHLGQGIFSLVLAVLEEDMKTQKFYNKYVKEVLQTSKEDGWLSIHKARFDGKTLFKKRYISDDPSANTKKAIASKNILTTGHKMLKLSIKERLIETYLTTNQLLTVLPLNLFLPGLSSKKKRILIENNEDIKARFRISKLTDWANPPYTTEEVARYLRNKYSQSDSLDYWEKKVQKIRKKASDIRDALI